MLQAINQSIILRRSLFFHEKYENTFVKKEISLACLHFIRSKMKYVLRQKYGSLTHNTLSISFNVLTN